MPVKSVAPGVTANWTPTSNGHVTRCHCGNPAIALALCAGHLQTAVVAAGVTRRAARRLLDVIHTAEQGGFNLTDPYGCAAFVKKLRAAATHLEEQL